MTVHFAAKQAKQTRHGSSRKLPRHRGHDPTVAQSRRLEQKGLFNIHCADPNPTTYAWGDMYHRLDRRAFTLSVGRRMNGLKYKASGLQLYASDAWKVRT